jgi:hypothetical protein
MATRAKTQTTTAALVCPECGKSFTRPAALGSHRQRVHGIAGSSKNATSRRGAPGAKTAPDTGRPRRTAGARRRRRSAAVTDNGRQTVDRDALLRTLFPAGIPPREDVLGAVNNWLDEAERLARLR